MTIKKAPSNTRKKLKFTEKQIYERVLELNDLKDKELYRTIVTDTIFLTRWLKR